MPITMEHRAALRKAKAIDLGLDVKSTVESQFEFDEFQSFVVQSHGKTAEPGHHHQHQGASEHRGPQKLHSYDAEISIPVPQVAQRPRVMERSVTEDASAKEPSERRSYRSRSKSPAVPSRSSHLRRTTTYELQEDDSSPKPDAAAVEASSAASRRQYKAFKHLTVPGFDEPPFSANGAAVGGGSVGGSHGNGMRSGSIQNAHSAEQLAPPVLSDSRRPSRGELVVRNFATSSKGIINMGDSFKSEDSSTSGKTSPAISRRSSCAVSNHHSPMTRRSSKQQSTDSAQSSTNNNKSSIYMVHVIGDRAVGKTSLCRQFATSEFLGDSDPDLCDEDDENLTKVTVQVDDHQATIIFTEIGVDQLERVTEDVDAFLVVYAIDQLSSFQFAENLLMNKLSKSNRTVPVFLVANKGDLVRTQVVANEDGKSLARHSHSIFAQTSATLCHRLDELLVQIVQEANGKHQPNRQHEHSSKITKWLCKLGGKINSKSKKWHSSPKRSIETEPDA